MAGVTGTTQIDDAVERFLAESRYTLQERPGVVKSSIRVERLPENEGPSVYIPKYGTVTTYALSDGIDMSQAQQITDTLMTLTPAEYGAQVILTDMMMMTVRDSFFNVAGKILADSFSRQQDETLCDDFDSFSGAIGSAGDFITLGHVLAGVANLKYNGPATDTAGRGGEPAPDPLTLVITPAQNQYLRKTLIGGIGDAGVTQVTPDPSKGATSGEYNIPGVCTVKTDVNLLKDTSGDCKGGLFSKEATILVELGSPAKVEKERDASLRGWELNFVGRWARGEYDDDWGREAHFDSNNPTT